jgi:hypothetical protein
MKPKHLVSKNLFTVLIPLLYAASSWAVDCDKACKAVNVKELDNDHVIIDVINGGVAGGRIRFPQTDRVQIVFINKNPFKYEYRFNILSKSLDQSVIDEGLLLLGFRMPTASGATTVAADFDCEGTDSNATEAIAQSATKYLTEFNKVVGDEEALRNLLTAYSDVRKKYDDFVDLTREDKIECSKICPKANELLPHLETLINELPKLDQALANAKKTAQAARVAHNELKNVISSKAKAASRQDCLDNADALARDLTAIEEKLPEYEITVTTARSQVDKVKTLRGIIRNLSDSSFTEIRYAPTTGASAVEISTFRRNIHEDNSKEAQVGDTVNLTVGESRFSLSGGIGWSTLESARIIRSRAPDPADATKTVEVFGEENNSELDPQIVAMMNARIGKPFNLFWRKSLPVSFAWSTGLVVATASSTDTVGTAYLTGPSLLLNDNAFVVSLLLHSARVGRLASGFKAGQPIPAELQDPLPLDNNRELGVMLAITYRTR